MISYQELRDALNELTSEQLKMNVSTCKLLENDEYQLLNITDMLLASDVFTDDEFDLEPNLPLLITN